MNRLLKISAAILSFLALATPVNADDWGCELWIRFGTTNRQVWGPVNLECGSFHPGPWSNWGVDSPYGSRQDSDQFAGWKREDDLWQWNTCTSKWPPPNADVYNACDSNCQVSAVGETEYGAFLASYDPMTPCTIHEQEVITIQEHWLDIYDLDPWWFDQYFTSILFDDQSVVLSCTGEGFAATCFAVTPFANPIAAPAEATAQAHMYAMAWYYAW